MEGVRGMKTKEGIDKISKEDFAVLPLDDGRKIIELLKRGEKFEQMWLEIQETEYPFDIDFGIIKQKYFPKANNPK